ncbi:Kef-type K+ transport system, membrane component KefB [Cupriavidus sp. OV038]|jgi:Kef-type K+ transport system membrane component KefB|uniref:cation:proton antiporter n=1 Tax=unclassified Cupriavidus TaxID=2640874 RepID=UPI0008E641A2|nr:MULTISPECIES: cation:proton antiporter [unclassified Cupriavidus]SFD32251.1 Kef-type K+ transport system, membrane component KefB [Cupriavidus sp. OV038]SFQ00753.1 Kef-type K+ transport system, membrane component KefB [Cupriavidus sp. OV096]
MNPTSIFFAQACLVVGTPLLLWRGLRMGGIVPLVVMQIVGGILLGPSLLGAFWPDSWQALFGATRLTALTGLQWLAAVLFAFLSGLHIGGGEARGLRKIAISAALGCVLVPFVLGVGAGLGLGHYRPGLLGEAATPWQFAIAVGVSMAVTALPVLGAILREMGLSDSTAGRLAVACAAVSDAAIWIVLSCILASTGQAAQAPLQLVLTGAAYVAAMFLIVRPLLAAGLPRLRGTDARLAAVVVLIFGSACASELIGLHYILGGFLAGVVLPRGAAADIGRQLEPTTVVVLMPFFFLMTGLRTDLTTAGGDALVVFAVATVVAVVGKMAGTALPARMAGLGRRDAWTLGALAQTKGLMEVVVLAILLENRLISAAAFSGLLLMALATTVVAKPLALAALRLREAP